MSAYLAWSTNDSYNHEQKAVVLGGHCAIAYYPMLLVFIFEGVIPKRQNVVRNLKPPTT